MTSSISSKDTFLLSGSFEWSPVSSLHASREEILAGSTSPESPWSPTCSQGGVKPCCEGARVVEPVLFPFRSYAYPMIGGDKPLDPVAFWEVLDA